MTSTSIVATDPYVLAQVRARIPGGVCIWLASALQMEASLTPAQRASLTSRAIELQAQAESGKAANLTTEHVVLSCLVAIASKCARAQQPLPADPAQEFVSGGYSAAAVLADSASKTGWSRVPEYCRQFPEVYLGALVRRAGRMGELARGDTELLRVIVAAAETLPPLSYPDTRVCTPLTEAELRSLLAIEAWERVRLGMDNFTSFGMGQLAAIAAATAPLNNAIVQEMLDAKIGLGASVIRRLDPSWKTWKSIATKRPRMLACRDDEPSIQAMMRAVEEGAMDSRDTHGYGWEFADGERRMLHCRPGYPLVPAKDGGSGPVSIGTPLEQKCPACTRGLICLFDIDLTHPSMRMFAMDGDGEPIDETPTRLRIPMCPVCTPYSGPDAVISADVDLQGDVRVRRKRRLEDEDDTDPIDLEVGMFILGEQLAEGRAGYGTLVGGLPRWEQEPDYIECPDCGNSMMFVGQHCEGPKLYAQFCRDCMVVAVNSQYD